MTPELKRKNVELLTQIANYRDANADMEMQIAANKKRINELQLEREMLCVSND